MLRMLALSTRGGEGTEINRYREQRPWTRRITHLLPRPRLKQACFYPRKAQCKAPLVPRGVERLGSELADRLGFGLSGHWSQPVAAAAMRHAVVAETSGIQNGRFQRRLIPAELTDDAHKQQVFDGLANARSTKMLDLATRRVRAERMSGWQSTFNQSGRGSSYARASIIAERIYERAAPIPHATPSPDRNSFLHEVAAVVESVCAEGGAALA